MENISKKTRTIVFKGLCAMMFMGFVLVSFAYSQGPGNHKPDVTEQLFKKGEALYQKQCAVCHGPQGNADGTAAYLLNPKPRNFMQDKFRLVSTNSMEATDDDLYKTITRGMPGSSMPPWGHFSVEDRWALVYYVRYLSEIGAITKSGELTDTMVKNGLPWDKTAAVINKTVRPENIIDIPPEPNITKVALDTGKQLFADSCAGCHGAAGKGDGQQKMVDSLGFPTRPRDLTAGIYKGASTSEELYLRMIAGMPGSPMPSYNDVFNRQQIWDLVHFVQTLAERGAEERSRLKYTQITARKISGEVPSDPLAGRWLNIKPIYVALTPLWWRDNRVEGVEVKAVHNGEDIAIYLTWSDPQESKNIVKSQFFSDGAALQFSDKDNPPFFGMGAGSGPVQIWHWKSAWEQAGEKREDIEDAYPHAAVDYYESQKNYAYAGPFEAVESKIQFHDPKFTTGWGAGNPLSDPHKEGAAEEAAAEGHGSYTTQLPENNKVKAKGVWNKGQWQVVFTRSLKPSEKGAVQFDSGKALSIALAIWDGSQQDRDGQKMVSIWNKFVLE